MKWAVKGLQIYCIHYIHYILVILMALHLLFCDRNEARSMREGLLNLSCCFYLFCHFCYILNSYTISLKITSYYSLILQVDPPEQEVDITQLSVIQSKRLEMELQIKVLSLETQLERQRQQLFELRKTQYAATGENFLLIFNHINLQN